jgi:hypothetical protein
MSNQEIIKLSYEQALRALELGIIVYAEPQFHYEIFNQENVHRIYKQMGGALYCDFGDYKEFRLSQCEGTEEQIKINL